MAIKPQVTTKTTKLPTIKPSRNGAGAGKNAVKEVAIHDQDLPNNELTNLDRDLRLLRAILQPATEVEARPVAARRPRTGQSATRSRTNTGAKVSKAIDKTEHDLSNGLSVVEQKKLAMSNFNTSLKALTITAKQYQEDRRQQNTDSTAKVLLSHKTAVPTRGVLEEQTIQKHADCATVALDVLRLHDNEDSSGRESSTKLENGAIALLDKLITLEMTGKAHAQASRIYEKYWKRLKVPNINANSQAEASEYNLQDLIRKPIKITSKSDFDITCAFQCQILRLAILEKGNNLDTKFMDIIELESSGSPGQIVQAGLQDAFIDRAKAAQNLLTITQALLKLYTILAKHCRLNHIDAILLPFSVLQEALAYKTAAFHVLEDDARLDNEIWPLLEKAIRRLWTEETENATLYSSTEKAITRLQRQLEKLRIPYTCPTSLIKYMASMASHNHNFSRAEKWLTDLASTTHGLENAMYLCQIAVLNLSADAKPLKSLGTACEALATRLDSDLSSDALLTLVRLRKACSEAMKNSAAQSEPMTSYGMSLGNACLCALYAIFDFLQQRISSSEAKLSQPIYLAALKTTEAIVDAERYAFSAEISTLDTYLTQIRSCAAFAGKRGATPGSQPGVRASIKIKLSNVLWRAHLLPIMTSRGSDAVFELASMSINCLDGLSKDELGKAALGPRLEKLAGLHIQNGQVQHAIAALERTIKHYIASDALANAVEASLTKQGCLVWTDTASLSSQLGRALHSLGSLKSSLEFHDFYDDLSLPEIHRTVLLEAQILYMTKKDLSSSTIHKILERSRDILQSLNSPPYSVWRLRFLSTVAYRLSRAQNFSDIDRQTLLELLAETLSNAQQSAGMFLMPYETSLRCAVRLQSILLSDRVQHASIRADILELSAFLTLHSGRLSTIVDDADILRSNLRSFSVRNFAIGRYEDAAACLEALVLLSLSDFEEEKESLCDYYISLAQCRVRLNDVLAGRKALKHVETSLPIDKLLAHHRIAFHLAMCEVELASCQKEACQHHLQQAAEIASQTQIEDKVAKGTTQLQQDGVVAAAALLASRLAMQQGVLPVATRYARQAAKISVSIWAALQKPKSRTISLLQKDNSAVITLTHELSNMALTKQPTNAPRLAADRSTLPYLRLYVDCLSHAADIFAHCGLSEDALHYHKQLQKLGDTIAYDEILFLSQSSYAKILAFSGMLNLATKQCSLVRNSNIVSAITYNIIETYLRVGLLEEAKQLSIGMTRSGMSSKKLLDCPEQHLPSEKERRQHANSKGMKAPAKRKVQNSATKPYKSAESIDQTNMSWYELEIEDTRQALFKEIALADENDLHSDELLASEPDLFKQPDFLVSNVLSTAKAIFRSAWCQLRSNTLQSVLTDSALALPAKSGNKRRHGRISLLQSERKADRSPFPQTQRDVDLQQTQSADSISHKLQTAQRLCELLLKDRKQHCSTTMINTIARLEARIVLLLSTLDQPFAISTTELVLKIGAPLDEGLAREMMISAAEELTTDRKALLKWPVKHKTYESSEHRIAVSRIDDLPHSWSIISIILAETKDELIVSKVEAKTEPFLVRIPLHRSNEGEATEEFGSKEALSEMRDIIAKANTSSHDERGAGDKQSRIEWHRERENLDERLQLLMQSIESIWLGGFRGILSPRSVDARMTKLFGKGLTQALNKHLPSRQRSSNVTERVVVHDQVLNLFLRLSVAEEDDLDDAVMDLLYFAIDILQVSGEKNAYDEIDWDALLVDTLDGLRACHGTETSPETVHTILVLDKELECIPWEALPCLIEHPVSRMPSLGAIFERLDQIRDQSRTASTFSINAATVNGSYILNPAGNLMPTQDRLQPVLASLKTRTPFTAMVNTPPNESQLSTLLSTSDILLYFGHGSGAQYIRPRTIRALPNCAAAFLFGCSSAKMTEHGDYESTGMPRAYMLGHSPAVVGCLWDVTDREIDRVAVKTLSEWGLVDGNNAKVQEVLSRSKSKGVTGARKKHVDSPAPVKKTLVEAVVEGRKVAVLRYLCGAAVVMYGIPVTLD